MKPIGNIEVTDERDAEFETQFGEFYRKRKALAAAGVHISPDRFDRTLSGEQLLAMKDSLIAAREEQTGKYPFLKTHC